MWCGGGGRGGVDSVRVGVLLVPLCDHAGHILAVLYRITVEVPQIQFFDVVNRDSTLTRLLMCPSIYFLRDAGLWTLISTSSCIWQCSRLLWCTSVYGCFWKNFTASTRRLCPSRSHVEFFNEHFVWRFGLAVSGVDAIFRTSPHGVESRLSADFLGSPRWPTVVGCRGLGSDEDAGSRVAKHIASPLTRDHNKNNNPIWGGSVSTGEEPPPLSGELKHALSPSRRPNPIPAIPSLCRQDTTSPWSTDYGGNS